MEKYTRLNFKNYYSKFRGDNNLCATFFMWMYSEISELVNSFCENNYPQESRLFSSGLMQGERIGL